MRLASVANVDHLVGYGVCPVCSTSVDTVDMVNAAADGVLLDDS